MGEGEKAMEGRGGGGCAWDLAELGSGPGARCESEQGHLAPGACCFPVPGPSPALLSRVWKQGPDLGQPQLHHWVGRVEGPGTPAPAPTALQSWSVVGQVRAERGMKLWLLRGAVHWVGVSVPTFPCIPRGTWGHTAPPCLPGCESQQESRHPDEMLAAQSCAPLAV